MSNTPETMAEDPRVAVLDQLETALDAACKALGPELVQMLADERIASMTFGKAPAPLLRVVGGRMH